MSNKKGKVIIYDLQTLPRGVSLRKIGEAAQKHGVIIYDSSYGGDKPSIISSDKAKRQYPENLHAIDICEDVQMYVKKYIEENDPQTNP